LGEKSGTRQGLIVKSAVGRGVTHTRLSRTIRLTQPAAEATVRLTVWHPPEMKGWTGPPQSMEVDPSPKSQRHAPPGGGMSFTKAVRTGAHPVRGPAE